MQKEPSTDATILLPLPPDFSCAILKPLHYVDFIADFIESKTNNDEVSSITLTIDEVKTFVWMLRDAGTVIHNLNEDLYGDECWSKIWWKNREKLESSGIKIPHWFEIERQMKGQHHDNQPTA